MNICPFYPVHHLRGFYSSGEEGKTEDCLSGCQFYDDDPEKESCKIRQALELYIAQG
jgi:hypothetical protein